MDDFEEFHKDDYDEDDDDDYDDIDDDEGNEDDVGHYGAGHFCILTGLSPCCC